MTGLGIANQLLNLAEIGWCALFCRALLRGIPRAVLNRTYGLWAGCLLAADALVDWTRHDHAWAVLDSVVAAAWLCVWWNSRPPRPPRRRLVLAPAGGA
ncbi:hypothetical protein [Parafrankia sp. EUN1f]|uniref:hypothetical protein n=1 Tax=Parafrankia sp. EUN1f TaxID=102897 RepID=UPI0001C4746E|nr:hypothetical protein [Parafrankia sp. EUN1f]EFC80064.1 hypothetical protein FrEUN1fDRAFT_6791 [Parafrankia sp. EUN1f]